MEDKPNKHITLWMILIILILAIAGMVAYIYWDKTEEVDQAETERQHGSRYSSLRVTCNSTRSRQLSAIINGTS
jgi:uncharacterized protein YpmB